MWPRGYLKGSAASGVGDEAKAVVVFPLSRCDLPLGHRLNCGACSNLVQSW